MVLNDRAHRFVELAEYLYRNNWVHFQHNDCGWTESLDGEEKVFGVMVRTLLCNDSESKTFYNEIGGYSGIKTEFDTGLNVVQMLDRKLTDRKMGTGKGSHRDGRHKRWTSRGIKEYLELTQSGQIRYFSNLQGYNELFEHIDSLYGCGPLTAFDVAKSMYESGIFPYVPDGFYLTGGGEVNGLRAIMGDVSSDSELIQMGNALTSEILQRTGMPETIVHFGLEDLLCIYQKQQDYLAFLNAEEFDTDFANKVLGDNCVRERGIGC